MRHVTTVLFSITALACAQESWKCPAGLDRDGIWSALQGQVELRYRSGPYLTSLGESGNGPTDAQEAARLALVKAVSGKITYTLQRLQKGSLAQEASSLTQSANFDQLALLHADPDLLCNANGNWIAEAHLRVEDYSGYLKNLYRDSAEHFRASVAQALKTDDVQAFTVSWRKAKRLHPAMVQKGLYLGSLLADASRGGSVDISAVLDKESFPEFNQDMALWQKMLAKRGDYMNAASVTLGESPTASGYSAAAIDVLNRRNIAHGSAKSPYVLRLTGQESCEESAYGSLWGCEVSGTAELVSALGKTIGKVDLRDESWKEFAPRDSALACSKAWKKMAASDELAQKLLTLFESVLPLE